MTMEEQQQLRPGTVLWGTYRIERVLGQGGFGITYLAYDNTLKRNVAIKEFFPSSFCSRTSNTSQVSLGTESNTQFVGKLREKFLKEARTIANFEDAPNIVRIKAAFEENNTAYYAMDYIEGESLAEMVKHRGPLSPEQAMYYIEQAVRALDFIHGEQMNHLDVKPANIMIRRKDDKAFLIDFGLSKRYDSKGNQTSTFLGGVSNGFAPMEQYGDGAKTFAPEMDIYSLGATLYYLLSGVVPPTATELCNEELTFPSEIPEYMVGPISKAMSMKRSDRHHSAHEFLDDINQSKRNQGWNRTGRNTDSGGETFINQGGGKGNEKGKPKEKHNEIHHGAETPLLKKVFTNFWTYVVIGVAAVFVCAVVIPKKGTIKSQDETLKVQEDVIPDSKVENMAYDVAEIGVCSYTGEINPETNAPNGKGKAIWNSEIAKSYDGEWKEGKMDGQGKYIYSNGDEFEGILKDNNFSRGTIRLKETRDMFTGTFKDGQPDQGTWSKF